MYKDPIGSYNIGHHITRRNICSDGPDRIKSIIKSG